MKQLLYFCVSVSILFTQTVSTAQSTGYFFDIRGSVKGLSRATARTPLTDWTYVGGGYPPPTVDEQSWILAMDSDSTGTIYGVDVFSDILGTVNPVNGDFTSIGPFTGQQPPPFINGMTIDQSSDIAYVTNGTGLWMMDIFSGETILLHGQFFDAATGDSIDQVYGLATDGAGNFFAFDTISDSLWDLDPFSGAMNRLGVFPQSLGNPRFSNNDIDFDPETGLLYASVLFPGGEGSYGTWNTQTGVYTEILNNAEFPVPATNSIGGPIACFGGTTHLMNYWSDLYHTFDTDNPLSNFVTFVQESGPRYWGMDFDNHSCLYVVNRAFEGDYGVMNPYTGGYISLGPLVGDYIPGKGIADLTCDPTTNEFYLASNESLYVLDVNTGVTTLVGDFVNQNAPGDRIVMITIACNLAGVMYGFDVQSDCLYAINKATGECIEVGQSVDDASFITGMDFDQESGVLYHIMYLGGGSGSYGSWDLFTGQFNPMFSLSQLPGTDQYQMKLAIAPPLTGSVVMSPLIANVTRGQQVGGSVLELRQSENLDFQSRRNSSDTQARVDLEFTAISPFQNPTDLGFTIEGSAFTRVAVNQTVEFYNFDTDAYEVLGTQATSRFSDEVQNVTATGDLSRFVSNADGTVRARVRFLATRPRAAFAVNTDHVFWNVSGN